MYQIERLVLFVLVFHLGMSSVTFAQSDEKVNPSLKQELEKESENPFHSGLPVEVIVPNKGVEIIGDSSISFERSQSKFGKKDYLQKEQPEFFLKKDEKTNGFVSNENKIQYKKIEQLVMEIRNRLCNVNPHGSYEVWLSFRGSAGILVSATAETGMKAVIKCD